jgi:hypothetical protein
LLKERTLVMLSVWECLGRINLLWFLLARIWSGRAAIAWLAPRSGRLFLEVECQPNRVFQKPEGAVYEMAQAWVKNLSKSDAEKVRCTLTWRARGGLLRQWQTIGAWCSKVATDMASVPNGVTESVDLLSNQEPQHLGLLVKYPGDSSAYIVTRSNYFKSRRLWKNSSFAVDPGSYEVDVTFTALGNRRGSVRLHVINDGVSGTIRCELLPTRSIGH